MSLKLTFRIEMTSDYHVGAGYGRGTEVDSALLRDADGVPVLRGTVLNGLLRDGLWRLLEQAPLQRWQQCEESGKEDAEEGYCGQYADSDFDPCPICRLFGTPRKMKRWRIGSARPVGRECLAGTKYEARETATQRVMRVRVDPRTRRAAPRKLFSEEQGGRLTFTFTATCPVVDEAALDEAALLMAGARFVRQLGRSRRRGQGECLFSLAEVEGANLGDDPQETLLKRFEAHWLKGKPEKLGRHKRLSLEQGREKAGEGRHVRLRVLARLDEPVIIAKRASAGNQFRSQPAIPGKALRGALAARAADRFDLEDKPTYGAFVKIFLRGAVRFPTLYPLFRSQRGYFYPAAPVPRDGFACKVYPDHRIQWGTKKAEPIKQCAEAQCDNAVKDVRGQFFSLRELEPKLFDPERQSEMHIRVDAVSGRVEEGQLFEYEALEAGQFFAGELICTDEHVWKLLQTLTDLEEKTPVPLRLGKATRRGYGKATLWLQRPDEDDEPSIWVKQPLAERVDEGENELTLTFLTNAIVTDAWGRLATGFEDEWLTRELCFPVKVMEGRDFAATHLLDGFNTHLRLPRWRDVALAAGSTVRLRIKEVPKGGLLNALARIEREGIGLRRNEGYGQVVFNHPMYDNCARLTSTRVKIPSEVGFVIRRETDEGARAKFRETWEKDLDDQPWDQCKDTRFLGLARWLDAHRQEGVDELLKKMEALGKPDELLIEHIGGAGECGDREIANPLTNEKCFELIKKLLKRLQEENEAHRPLGVRMLADRLAEVTGE